jgi:lysophospholipase L1-like esterase
MKRALLAAAAAFLIAAAPAAAETHRHLLALGDSDAFGFQFPKYHPGVPAAAFDTGFADVIAAREHLSVVNYSCPGESTVTFAAGGCPYPDPLHDAYAGSQLDAALAFLHGPEGKKTRLITLTLWGNDINAFLAESGGDLSGAPAAIAAFGARLSAILQALQGASGGHATLVVTGVYDPFQNALSSPLYQALDQAIAAAAQTNDARFAPLLAIFDGRLCALTLLCSDGDAHPSDAGYAAIAEAILA